MWRFLWVQLFSNAHPPFETARQMARPPFWISRQKFFKSWPTEIAVNWSRTPERCGRLALRCSRCRSDMKWAALCRRLLHDSAPSKQLFLFLNALSREHSSFGDYHCTAGHQVYKVGFSCYITYKKQHFFVLGQVMETRCTVMLPSIVSVLCHNFEKEHTKGSIVAWRRQSWPYGHRYTRGDIWVPFFYAEKLETLNFNSQLISLHILAFNNVDVNRFQTWTVPKSKMRLHLPLLGTPSPRP